MGGVVSDRSPGYYLDAAIGYARAVIAGDIPACKWTKAACRRQLDNLESSKGDSDYPFEFRHDKAEHICRFIELLPHTKGKWAGTKIVLEPWQIFILTTVFGWYNKATGTRRFRCAYIEVPRKNAKSTLSSGVALYMLTADREPGAEVYSAATTREQARIVFNDAKKMAEREPEFRRRFGVRLFAHSIAESLNDSMFSSLSAEGSTLDGLNVHFASVDELHAHRTRAVWDVIETGMGAREQPLLWAITTAGVDRSGICYEQRAYVCNLLNSTLRRHDGLGYPIKGAYADDDTYFGIIYTIDDTDEWSDERCWAKANPNYGVSVYPDDIRRLAAKAIKVASARSNFLTKRLNVWVNAATAWLDMRKWDECADPSLDIEDFLGEQCIAALDLASKVDLAAKAKLFSRILDDGRRHFYLFVDHYLPEDAATDDRNSQYAGWVEDGYLITTPGNVTDYDKIEEDLLEDNRRFDVSEVPYDPFQATQLSTHMTEAGVPMVEFRQTVLNMSEPMKELEALVLQKRLHHTGCPVLTWQMGNVIAFRDAKDNIYPRKEREENKIDGPVAGIMALARAIIPGEEQPAESVYEQGVSI